MYRKTPEHVKAQKKARLADKTWEQIRPLLGRLNRAELDQIWSAIELTQAWDNEEKKRNHRHRGSLFGDYVKAGITGYRAESRTERQEIDNYKRVRLAYKRQLRDELAEPEREDLPDNFYAQYDEDPSYIDWRIDDEGNAGYYYKGYPAYESNDGYNWWWQSPQHPRS